MEAPQQPGWYLFDYGMVISTAPEAEDWEALEEAAGIPLRHSGSTYWMHRLDYDEGKLDPVQYWSLVLGREVGIGLASELDSLDAIQWSHLNLDTLDVLEMLHSRGARLAVLSNMPAAMAEEFSTAPWTKYFAEMFFSSGIGLTKPEPGVFRHVLDTLATDPAEVVFIDDQHANVHAARTLGINAIHHTPGTDLLRELGL
ncbi:HAD family hydrolase [Arthrobacter mobilis]|uniref:HAD family phosphatase n=1 Tax=Arthrobacter mobilis TaxID=2724944 RepID=A0A7X6K5R5_9MICC|nr:HAD family phosphatase [Arthrobacter mobilis]NKX54594.1 HAD family phosphatase [Arthrobacter mobilis]